MGKITLRDEYVDPRTEQGLISAFAAEPDSFFEHQPPETLFEALRPEYERVRDQIEAGADPNVTDTWDPADDPAAAIARLQALHTRRRMAEVQEILATGLSGDAGAQEVLDRASDALEAAPDAAPPADVLDILTERLSSTWHTYSAHTCQRPCNNAT